MESCLVQSLLYIARIHILLEIWLASRIDRHTHRLLGLVYDVNFFKVIKTLKNKQKRKKNWIGNVFYFSTGNPTRALTIAQFVHFSEFSKGELGLMSLVDLGAH